MEERGKEDAGDADRHTQGQKLPHAEITRPYNTRGSLKRGIEESKGKSKGKSRGGSSSQVRVADLLSKHYNYAFSVFQAECMMNFNKEHPNGEYPPGLADEKWRTMTDDERAPYAEEIEEGDTEYEKFKKAYAKRMKLSPGETTRLFDPRARDSLKSCRCVEDSKSKRSIGNYPVMKPLGRPCKGGEASSIKGLDQVIKERPMYFLYESGSGYALLLAHDDLSGIENNYECAEKFITRPIDEIFKLVAFHHFENINDAMSELDAISKGNVSDKLMKFLVDNLPKVKRGAPKTFALTLQDPKMVDQIVLKTGITCGCCVFHKDIMRGVRMYFNTFIKDFMDGDLKKSRLELARLYSRKMVV